MAGLYKHQSFSNNKYCISLLVGCDGADARKAKKGREHSVFPIIFNVLCFSLEFRHSMDFVLCAGMVPGPWCNNLEVFLRVVFDEVPHVALLAAGAFLSCFVT